jgi:hypothetical protein
MVARDAVTVKVEGDPSTVSLIRPCTYEVGSN